MAAYLSYEDWLNQNSSDWGATASAGYNDYLRSMGITPDSDGTGSGSTGPSLYTLNLGSNQPYQRPAGIPAYNGYQAPNYAATTPNTTHWLNTMNAFAPTARTDMKRLLGQGGGGSSGGLGGTDMLGRARDAASAYKPATGVTQPAYTPSILTPEQQANPLYKAPSAFPSTGLLGGPTQPAATQPTQPQPVQNQGTAFPTQWERAGAPGYMDAFWNVPGSAYAPPGTPTQPAYSQPASTQQSSWSNGTVGINPATGSLTFL